MAAEMKLSNEAVQLLNMETCKKGLKTLGLHPVTQRHAFLELSLPSLGIEDVGVLQNFPQIVYLDISHNCISSLRVLENLSSLLQLRARSVPLRKGVPLRLPHCPSLPVAALNRSVTLTVASSLSGTL